MAFKYSSQQLELKVRGYSDSELNERILSLQPQNDRDQKLAKRWMVFFVLSVVVAIGAAWYVVGFFAGLSESYIGTPRPGVLVGILSLAAVTAPFSVRSHLLLESDTVREFELLNKEKTMRESLLAKKA